MIVWLFLLLPFTVNSDETSIMHKFTCDEVNGYTDNKGNCYVGKMHYLLEEKKVNTWTKNQSDSGPGTIGWREHEKEK